MTLEQRLFISQTAWLIKRELSLLKLEKRKELMGFQDSPDGILLILCYVANIILTKIPFVHF